ncbi:5'/3'-nucleotidase SurE [Prosthecomicrobium pneumaticum]|uniref:5'-nucleotidase SurE n=1 Tax=Prosthecomicrobium pneumaticum TaxID=81895 RepID=A0A7W9FPP8_9HYPH|nr:5'/3'-nucleotidase SurE [Prosthecomicrobium pneumaticum]MBB5754587.1 5'-nucleotidase [Prosthecomicrobium pneumaticum]
MRILITNDDGIHAPGLQVLKRIAESIADEVWVVAPETDQSGLAHSLTLNDPLRLRAVSERVYALRGTPTDCVIMGVRHVLPEPPDLVLSGVNSGQNTADDVSYSGTVAGAIEGTLLGIPAIALSQAYDFADGRRIIPWDTAERHAPAIIRKLLDKPAPRGCFYNINFPNVAPDAVTGVEVTSQGQFPHRLFIDERRDGRGNPYFWVHHRRSADTPPEGSDVHAIGAGAISITPLRIDQTAYDLVHELTQLFD